MDRGGPPPCGAGRPAAVLRRLLLTCAPVIAENTAESPGQAAVFPLVAVRVIAENRYFRIQASSVPLGRLLRRRRPPRAHRAGRDDRTVRPYRQDGSQLSPARQGRQAPEVPSLAFEPAYSELGMGGVRRCGGCDGWSRWPRRSPCSGGACGCSGLPPGRGCRRRRRTAGRWPRHSLRSPPARSAAVGTWWASREIPRRAGTAEAGGAAAGPGGPAAGERSITAGGDISGIASTGNDATNIQR